MQIRTLVGGVESPPEKLYTLGEVSEKLNIPSPRLRRIYKDRGFMVYNIGNAVCITENDYRLLFQHCTEINLGNSEQLKEPTVVLSKGDYKRKAKSRLKKKFRIGDLLSLKIKSKEGSKEIIKGFKVVKFIYTINDTETNILVLKQIYGPKTAMHTLNRHDCRKLHIRFEPGLQVFSMFMNWGVFRNTDKKQERISRNA